MIPVDAKQSGREAAPRVCTIVWADWHRHDLLVCTTNEEGIIVSLDGVPLAPALPEPIRSDHKMAMVPGADIAAAGNYYKRTVTGYNWRSGEKLWTIPNCKEIYNIYTCGESRFLIHSITGRCLEVDALTGSIVAEVRSVGSVAAQGAGPAFVLLRTVRGSKLGRLEYMTSLDHPPLFVSDGEMSEISSNAFGPGWMALYDITQRVVIALSDTGEEIWRHDAPPDRYYPCLTRNRDGKVVFAIERGLRGPKGSYGVVLDAATGQVLHKQPIEMPHSWLMPVAEGEYIACTDGLLRTSDMAWLPRRFGEPPPG